MGKGEAPARDAAALLLALLVLAAAVADRACRTEIQPVEWTDRHGYSVDLNSADATLLTLLPGIGPRLAADLVAWREQNGPFRSAADLEKVRGIGPHRAGLIMRWSHLGEPRDAAGGFRDRSGQKKIVKPLPRSLR
jgi:competence ComEA-like helix-hairpin-helix protein